jgi:hypothetical protein
VWDPEFKPQFYQKKREEEEQEEKEKVFKI